MFSVKGNSNSNSNSNSKVYYLSDVAATSWVEVTGQLLKQVDVDKLGQSCEMAALEYFIDFLFY